jgi:hypothetical protein
MDHRHRWTPLKKGFPQKICACGLVAVKELRIGKNTITLSPGGNGDDTMRYSLFGTPGTVSQLAMDPSTGSGRPVTRQGQFARRLRLADEAIAKKFWRYNQDADTTSILNINSTATISVVGTPSVLSVTGGQFISYSSGGDNGWANTSFNETQKQGFPTFVAYIRTGPIVTSVNYHIGLTSSDPFTTNPSMGMVRFNTGAGDTTWMAVTGNGASAGGTTAVSLGLSVTANTIYLIRIQFTTTGVGFQIASVSGTGNVLGVATLPVSTALLGTFARMRALSGTREFGISHVAIAENNPYL